MGTLERVFVEGAPRPLGAYCHAAVVDGHFIVTAGLSARDPKTNRVPGLELGASGERLSYDIKAETRGCLENLKQIVETAGGGLETVVEVQVFLTDMRDFAAYNEVFAEYFQRNPPARTTVGVSSLPGPLAIEIKALALRRGEKK